MTVSYWRRTTRLGEIRCDTAVLGGGIVGVSAALALERAGVDALVVERHTIGAGASTRNAGFLMRGAADNYEIARRDYGPPLARHLWRWSEETLQGLLDEGIDRLPMFRRVPSCLLALEEVELAELRRSSDMLAADGFDVGWIEPGSLAADDDAWRSGRVLGGLLNPNDASANPREVLELLAGKLRREPLLHQEAFALSLTADGVAVRTADALVRCRRVLVCLNAYTPLLLPTLAGLLRPNRGQMIAVDAGPLRLGRSYYANRGGEYFRQPDPATIVVGGRRRFFEQQERTRDDQTADNLQADLEDFAASILGQRRPVKARWAGVMAFTPDGLPLVGPLEPSARLWLCSACHGHGMSLGHRTARAAVEEMLGGPASPFPLSRLGPLPSVDPKGP
ncbi:MAG: FAD-binding oxidoreductase [Phycisphaerales bacterium]|nr:FAD-binding oxidoreductase [Phycisphaerales bacterium]